MKKPRDRQCQRGISLIELIIALAVIAIGAATISTLIVNSLQSVQDTESYSETLREAEACYETILSIHENNFWVIDEDTTDQEQVYLDCTEESGWTDITVNQTLAEAWIAETQGNGGGGGNSGQGQGSGLGQGTEPAVLFENACQKPTLEDSNANLQCRGREVDGEPALQFRITAVGSRTIELIVPIRDNAEEGN